MMNLSIKMLETNDVTERYVRWFDDQVLVAFSDSQYRSFTLEGQKLYVDSFVSNQDCDLYGIFDDDLHIGNISILGLESVHRRAEISYLVGERSYWGKGVGSFAVSMIVGLADTKYDLYKLFAGVAKGNVASQKVLEKNGFTLEGQRRAHLYYNENFYDQLDYGLVLSERRNIVDVLAD